MELFIDIASGVQSSNGLWKFPANRHEPVKIAFYFLPKKIPSLRTRWHLVRHNAITTKLILSKLLTIFSSYVPRPNPNSSPFTSKWASEVFPIQMLKSLPIMMAGFLPTAGHSAFLAWRNNRPCIKNQFNSRTMLTESRVECK